MANIFVLGGEWGFIYNSLKDPDLWRASSTRSIAASISTSISITQTPGTLEELRTSLRLGSSSEAEALLRAWPVKEAFHSFVNRCLSSRGPEPRPIPDWKVVDGYLHEKRLDADVRKGKKKKEGEGEALEERVAGECLQRPYEPLPHVAMFVLRMARFMDTEEGGRFDVGPRRLVKKPGREFDRCVRATQLLGFLLKRHREGAVVGKGKGKGEQESETDKDEKEGDIIPTKSVGI
ncbi:hypothetical protein F5X99DRAFT_423380 [Biscogniauxia marginata]|nr:hypothetical protein F5X99DRAFT_423380 [Biscogniauxia marginata]